MEERIIDDEYGRGVRLKKTEDGYVDVTDAALGDEEGGEELAFEFPVFDEDVDDEDLVGLSPEEAVKLRRQKEEAAAARRAEYEKICEEGDKLLEAGSFKAAELKFEKALSMDAVATEATVGYWRAKTADFEEPEALVEEYAEEGSVNLEYDLGADAVEIIRNRYADKFRQKLAEIDEEEKELAEKVEKAQARRRRALKKRVKKWAIPFAATFLVVAAAVALSIVFFTMNYRVSDGSYIPPTIVAVCAFVISFVAFGVFTNKFVNACRMYRANEKLSSTDDGERLVHLREYREIYEFLIP